MVVKLPAFDRYYHYLESVQSPEEDVRFMAQVARESRGAKTKLRVFREDFCGTFTNCCEWVKLGPDYVAHGVDLDPEPIAYGKANYLNKLTPNQQSRWWGTSARI